MADYQPVLLLLSPLPFPVPGVRVWKGYGVPMEGVWNGYGAGMEPTASKPAPAAEFPRS